MGRLFFLTQEMAFCFSSETIEDDLEIVPFHMGCPRGCPFLHATLKIQHAGVPFRRGRSRGRLFLLKLIFFFNFRLPKILKSPPNDLILTSMILRLSKHFNYVSNLMNLLLSPSPNIFTNKKFHASLKINF